MDVESVFRGLHKHSTAIEVCSRGRHYSSHPVSQFVRQSVGRYRRAVDTVGLFGRIEPHSE